MGSIWRCHTAVRCVAPKPPVLTPKIVLNDEEASLGPGCALGSVGFKHFGRRTGHPLVIWCAEPGGLGVRLVREALDLGTDAAAPLLNAFLTHGTQAPPARPHDLGTPVDRSPHLLARPPIAQPLRLLPLTFLRPPTPSWHSEQVMWRYLHITCCTESRILPRAALRRFEL